MIFVRTYHPHLDEFQLANLLSRANLDLLQLDIAAPNYWRPLEGEGSGGGALAGAMSQVHAAIYLRPEFCVVTNAGYHGIINCLSALAEFLVAHGNSDLPISAIRGDNLLPDLRGTLPAALYPEGAKVLSARAELGAGPFATAFAEGARIVIAGSYDISAPLLGAAVAQGLCGWQDHHQLALLAAAAHFEDIEVVISADGSIGLASSAIEQLDQVRAAGAAEHADVHADFTVLALEPTHRKTLQPSKVRSVSPSTFWNARLVVESGFQASALVVGEANRLARLIDQLPIDLLVGTLNYSQYHAAIRNQGDENVLTRIEYASPSEEICQEFVNWLQLSLWRSAAIGQLITPFPKVEQLTETISVQVPADSVTISVDTRPAREWL